MYSHELSDALKKLAIALKKAPNMPIEDISSLLNMMNHGFSQNRPSRRSSDLPLALSALLSFSKFDKQEWLDLISDLGLDIEIRPRDASRDILGKVLKVLESEPEMRERLRRRVTNKEANASPELAKALSSLLGK